MASAGQAPNIVFKGIDGNECEEFIAAIEELAFAEGWSRDRERMLLFARSRLRHKALRWFARLDPSKKSDWDSFVEALFEQYPLVEVPEAEITTPVWSATTFSPGTLTVVLPPDHVLDSQQTTQDEGQAANNGTLQSGLPHPLAYNPSIPGRHMGVLRIVVDEESTPPQYIWHGRRKLSSSGYVVNEEQLSTTLDRQEALLVCFLQSSEPHPIGCLNTTCYLGSLSLCFQPCGTNSYMVRAANGTGKPQGSTDVQNVSKVWNVLAEGTVQATLSEFDPKSINSNYNYYTRKEDFKTTEVHLDTSGSWISFVKPGTPLQQTGNNDYDGRPEVKARIVFEPR